jgi:hypothetical protein
MILEQILKNAVLFISDILEKYVGWSFLARGNVLGLNSSEQILVKSKHTNSN